MDNVFGWQCPSPEGKRKCQSDDQTTSNLASTLLSLIYRYQLGGAMSKFWTFYFWKSFFNEPCKADCEGRRKVGRQIIC